jgi:SAM-dependent methyltransferase
MSLTRSEIEKKLSNETLEELLALWQMEQGAEKVRDLDLMAAAIPFRRDAPLRVLDLGCGPGDVGRAIHSRFPKSRIDSLDRDLFLISMCIAKNRRDGVPGESFTRDLWDANWCEGLAPDYEVIATANSFHWLDVRRVAALFKEVFRLLRSGGAFLFVEPACSETMFASGFDEWKSRQPSRYRRENWERNSWLRSHGALGLTGCALDTRRRHAGIGLDPAGKRCRLRVRRRASPRRRRGDTRCGKTPQSSLTS